jgi:hypothetical protein
MSMSTLMKNLRFCDTVCAMNVRLAEVFKGEPVDRKARLVTGEGEHSEHTPVNPEVADQYGFTLSPHPLFDTHLKGIKQGRFTVRGTAKRGKDGQYSNKVRYSCLCTCGAFELRTRKALFNPSNTDDCCVRCRKRDHLNRIGTILFLRGPRRRP